MTRPNRSFVQPIHYRSGYKYQLTQDWRGLILEFKGFRVSHPFFEVHPEAGQTWIKAGYAWNGSDIVWDSPWCLLASLFHDLTCQAHNEGLASREFRAAGDLVYKRVCLLHGMPRPLAWLRYRAISRYTEQCEPNPDWRPILIYP